MKSTSKNLLISSFCVLVVFISNFVIPSSTNGFSLGINTSIENIWDSNFADQCFDLRYKNSEFRRRPFILEFQKLTKEILNIPYQFSFNFINYLLLFLFFLQIPNLLKSINSGKIEPRYSQLFLLFSMPIIFAFYGSVFSYDDFLQYFLLILFLINLFNEKFFFAIIFLSVACIARETSFFYYYILMGYYFIKKSGKNYYLLLFSFIPIIVYYIFFINYIPDDLISQSKDYLLDNRFFHWESNFIQFKHFRESTTIILLIIGLPLHLLYQKYNETKDNKTKQWIILLISFIFINTTIVATTALVRESRLLFLPLLIVIPFISLEIENTFLSLKQIIGKSTYLKKTSILIVSVIISFVWYTPYTTGTGYFFKTYALFYFYIWILIISNKGKLHSI